MNDVNDLEREIRALGNVTAPAGVLPEVMAQLDLGDAYVILETPIGPVFIAYNTRGISAVMRADDPAYGEQEFRRRFGRPAYRTPQPPSWLARAMAGESTADLRFDLRGLSEFEQAVLLKAREIPRGEIRPYAWIAREIGRPGAVRAVGSALAHNPIPLLIPCHRVVRSDGSIGQYSMGGPEVKRAILAAEGIALDELEPLMRAGVRYVGSDTTGIYCFPTCRNARRITERHRVTFRSDAEAQAAGYRPCLVCRPAAAG